MSDIIAHIGTDDDETIHGFNQNDTLNSRGGDDTLHGYLGDDIYVYERGNGHDTIDDFGRKGDDYGYYNGGIDTLKFGEGIGENDLLMLKENDDVLVYIKNGNQVFKDIEDRITLKNWFLSNNRIEKMALHDGTTLNYSKYLYSEPTVDDDALIYGDGDDVIDALSGDDTIVDLGGNNIIDGNSGNDTLQSGDGNDTLIGGIGDDTLYAGKGDDQVDGSVGSDTYIYNFGDGHDVISDYTQDSNDIDQIIFGQEITVNNLNLTRTASDLIITIDNDNSIVVQNWYAEEGYRIESFDFADGSKLTADQIEQMTVYYGDEVDNVMVGTKNGERIFALEGNDTIQGGIGDDTIDGGIGSDTYIFNVGDGHDTLSDYSQNTANIDKIQFGDNITIDSVEIIKSEHDLIVKVDQNNSIIIENWFLEESNKIESFNFSDGSILGINQIEQTAIYYGHQDGIFLFNRGDGQYQINDYSESNGIINIDTIRFGKAINKDDLVVFTDWIGTPRQAKVLTIALKEEKVDVKNLKDFINISNWSDNTIECIQFSDGMSILSVDEIIGLQATSQDDTIIGTNYNNVLTGGTGNDGLFGGYGNDTYIFNKGDGQDVIYDDGSDSYSSGEDAGSAIRTMSVAIVIDTSHENQDVIEFGSTITTIDEIVAQLDGDSLVVGIKDGDKVVTELSDKITIYSWLSWYDRNTVETIRLADGTTYNISAYFNIPLQGSSEGIYYGSPIILDLNHNGVTSTTLRTSTVFFDYDADGNREHTAWIDVGDAQLVTDINQDGIINDGSEIFGEYAKLPNGTLA
ncbi:MAG: calcium-binding protein, partial [Sulfuricurvum sp.]|nr:calcium-binding protein [Sulfuricurvum sp.]